jgi:hypothetical protein
MSATVTAEAALPWLNSAHTLSSQQDQSTVESASIRRRLEGNAQQLQILEPASLDESLEAAHAVLVVTLDELTWAVRMTASRGYADAPGMQAAVRQLAEHAQECVNEARALLRSARSEEIGSPA